jgi:outer membrane protein TolC
MRIGLLTGVLVVSLYAEVYDFEKLKAYALTHTPTLRQAQLRIAKSEAKNALRLRSLNPVLSLEAARFDNDTEGIESGYGISFSQSIRMPGYYDAQKKRAEAVRAQAVEFARRDKAMFVRDLALLYTDYVAAVKRRRLWQEELKLVGRLRDAAKARLQAGTATRADVLRADIEAHRIRQAVLQAQREETTLQRELFAYAGIEGEAKLKARFLYPVARYEAKNADDAPESRILQAQLRRLQAEARETGSIWRTFEFQGGYEKEPDWSVARVGIALSLPLHHTRSQERRLAALERSSVALEKSALERTLAQRKTMYRERMGLTIRAFALSQKSVKEQRRLIAMLEEDYRLYKGSLFALLQAKRDYLQSRKSQIALQRLYNIDRIRLRYLQGAYNE